MADKAGLPDNVINVDFTRNQRGQEGAGTGAGSGGDTVWLPGVISAAAGERMDRARIERGLELFEFGGVLDIHVGVGQISGRVHGSRKQVYSVRIVLARRTEEHVAELWSSPDLEHQLLSLRPPRRVADSFLGAPGEIRFHCNCPDPAQVCKHAYALSLAVEESFEEEPRLLLGLRPQPGKASRLQLPPPSPPEPLSAVVSAPSPAAPGEPAGTAHPTVRNEAPNSAATRGGGGVASTRAETASTNARFWEGTGLPELPSLERVSALEESDMDLFHAAMRTVSVTTVEQLRAVSDVEELYEHLMEPPE